MNFCLVKTPHRESPEYALQHSVCRECKVIQPCAVIRGWTVCRNCLEQIDHAFCSARAGEAGKRMQEEIKGVENEHEVHP